MVVNACHDDLPLEAPVPDQRRRDEEEAGRTVVVQPGESLVLPSAGGQASLAPPGRFGDHPRVRSGYALKRLEASEDPRWKAAAFGVAR